MMRDKVEKEARRKTKTTNPRRSCSLLLLRALTLLFLLLLAPTSSATPRDLQSHLSIMSRVVVRVKGRDPDRQLTTFRVREGDSSSQLNFGFLPTALRQHSTERMELFEFSSSSENIRRVTLRHPWYGVYMTSESLHVRACHVTAYAERGSSPPCPSTPYLYLERLGPSNEYRIRVYSKQRGGNSRSVVSYAHVSEYSWEVRFRSQLGLITQALAVAARRIWRESLNVLFKKHVKSHEKRRRKKSKRRRSCSHPAVLRDLLYKLVTIEDFKLDIRGDLRHPVPCDDLYMGGPTAPAEPVGANNTPLASSVPWKEMTSEQKRSLVCSVGHVVCRRLRKVLLEQAKKPCFRRKPWGMISEQRRVELLDRNLTIGWLRRRAEADRWLVEVVEQYFDAKTTTFVFT